MAHTEEVIKKIAKDFRVNIKGNPDIRPLQKKLIKKTATYTVISIVHFGFKG